MAVHLKQPSEGVTRDKVCLLDSVHLLRGNVPGSGEPPLVSSGAWVSVPSRMKKAKDQHVLDFSKAQLNPEGEQELTLARARSQV